MEIKDLINEYQSKIDAIDKYIKEKKEYLSEIRYRISRPHTTCYTHDDYEQMRDDYKKTRHVEFIRRQSYVQFIEDLKEIIN